MKLVLWTLLGLISYVAPAKYGSLIHTSITGFKTSKDKVIANRLVTELRNRIHDLEAGNASGKAGETGEMEDLLKDALDELLKMESEPHAVFTFEYIEYTPDPRTNGYSCRGYDSTIIMHFLNDTNLVHELTHGWQIYKGKIVGVDCEHMRYSGIGELCQTEVIAYKRQYAFAPETININAHSWPKDARQLSDINCKWVLGLNTDMDNFVFGKHLMGQRYNPKDFIQYLKLINKDPNPVPSTLP